MEKYFEIEKIPDPDRDIENLISGNLRKKLSEGHIGSLVKVLLSHPETRQKIYHLLGDSKDLSLDNRRRSSRLQETGKKFCYWNYAR